MSESSISQLVRYLQTRLPLSIYLPLAAFLYVASLIDGGTVTLSTFIRDSILCLALLLQFRLWDDLVDAPTDRRHNPDRVLCRTDSLKPFYLALFFLLAFNLAAIAALKTTLALTVFLLLNTGMWLWYAIRRTARLRVRGNLNHRFVLMKYPAIVFLLVPMDAAVGNGLLAAMTLVYFCFCIYETLHDPPPKSAAATIWLGVEMSLLWLAAAFMFSQQTLNLPAKAWPTVLGFLGAAGLAALFQRFQAGAEPGRWCYSVFLIGFCWLISSVWLSPDHRTTSSASSSRSDQGAGQTPRIPQPISAYVDWKQR